MLIATCHCKETTLTVPSPPKKVTQCTCSICSKRGALWAYYPQSDVEVQAVADDKEYRWQSKSVGHHFCGKCGCTTYTVSPTFDMKTGKADFNKMNISVNARLFDDFDLDAVPVEVIDGKNLW